MARRGDVNGAPVRFVVVDVDDVLIATADALEAAANAMLVPLSQHFGKQRADAVRREFVRAMHIGLRRLRTARAGGVPGDEYAELMRRIAWWQRGVTAAGFEVKAWSRHALLACALEACDLPVTAAIVESGGEAYWTAIAERAFVYPDAEVFVRRLRDAGVAVHLATGSDGFLAFDDDRQTFSYAPEESRRLKLERLRRLTSLGFSAEDITIADPVGKPSPLFYREVLRRFARAAGGEIDLKRTVVIGDSLANDVLPLLSLGATRGIWLLRDDAFSRDADQLPEHVAVVRALDSEEVWRVRSAG